MALRLPDFVPPKPVVPRKTLDRTSTTVSDLQATVAADGDVIPNIYGQVKVGPMIGPVVVSGSKLYMLTVWCLGEVFNIHEVTVEDDALLGTISASIYKGTTTQTADPTLSNLISGYSDTLVATVNGESVGICYTVLGTPASDSKGFPLFNAEIKGRKLYDPRRDPSHASYSGAGSQDLSNSSTWEYSTNPSLCLADFIRSPIYGAGRTLDWASVATAADVNDELLSDGTKRRELNLAMARPARIADWVETLREYAGCFVITVGSTVKLIADRPVNVAAADNGTATAGTIKTTLEDTAKAWTVDQYVGYKCVITSGTGIYQERRIVSNTADTLTLERRWGTVPDATSGYQIWQTTAGEIVENSLKLSKRGQRDTPTVMRVVYTDTSSNPWRDAEAIAQVAGVDAGTVPRRESVVHLEGIQRYAQAVRQATERLNKLRLTDLDAEWIAFDEAITFEPGDVVPITHPIGLTVKLMRILQVDPIDLGRWRIVASEYDPAVYSDAVPTAPTFADTSLASPLNPPAPTDVAVAEELFQDESGTTHSRVRATWTGIDWPFARDYRVTITGDGTALESTITHRGVVQHSAVTGPVKQGILYVADVETVSTVGALSPADSANLTAQGKLLKPTDVPELTGFEAGQFTSLSWTAAIDIDLKGYKIKRGTTSSTWETADTIIAERVDATTFLANAQPEGTWRYYIKALDSVGQESNNAAFVDIVVTGDASNSVLAHESTLAAATLVNMHSYEVSGGAKYAITSYGQAWSQRFGAAGSTWSANGTKAWCLGHPDTAAAYVETGEWDISIDRNGNWKFDTVVDLIESGTGTAAKTESVLLAKSAEYPTFTEFSGRSTVKTARYYKAKILDGGNNGDAAIRVRFPIQDSLIGAIIKKSGTASIPASPQPLTVTFDEQYAGAPKINLVTTGTAPRIVTADNIAATGFDLYAWDTAGAAAAATVAWEAEGS